MTIQQAIEKAIEGGYRRPEPCNLEGIPVYHKGDTFLDPIFWQSLGKAMGWPSKGCMVCGGINGIHTSDMHQILMVTYWEFMWHRFINQLAEGKTDKSFFEKL